jgi:hypothetical protein
VPSPFSGACRSAQPSGRSVSGQSAILIALTLAMLGGCAHDRRGLVATKTLLNGNGAFDEAAYGAAIRARFPDGSSLESFQRYVRATKGECHERSSGRIRCEIPYRGGFCWAQIIGLDVQAEGPVIKNIRVQIGGLGC